MSVQEIAPGSPIGFEALTPLNDKIIRRHIKKSMSLGLPEMDGGELRTLNIIANGPSAKGQVFEGPCMALNGALGLFSKENPPLMWAACDPQEIVASFLTDPPRETTYIVASKCHPKVFKALRDRDVRLWHINDQPIENVRKVPCAVSITLCAMMLAHRLGWRRLNVWGWDCCYGPAGEFHAAGPGSSPAQPVDILVGDRTFHTHHTWACEVQDAVNIIPVLEWCGTEVNIHGDGMLAAIRDYRDTVAVI